MAAYAHRKKEVRISRDQTAHWMEFRADVFNRSRKNFFIEEKKEEN
jgi:hypothetical protein